MQHRNKYTDLYIRGHLESIISENDLIELRDLEVDGSKLYYKNELVEDVNLAKEEEETLLVILGKKYTFECPNANHLKCEQHLIMSGLIGDQIDTVLKEKDFEKRYDLVQEMIKVYEQELLKAQKSENPLITQRSLYHSSKKPLHMSFADESVDCQVARERCELLQTFYDKNLNTIQKIKSLLRLEHPEWGHNAVKDSKEDDPKKKEYERDTKFFSY